MQIKDIVEFQKQFDVEHGWLWSPQDTETKRLNDLQYATIALLGELGEFSNIVKKILREYNHSNAKPTEEMIEKLKEELTDVFIYLVKVSIMLDFDLEKTYLQKMSFNKERFKRFEVKK